MEDYLKAFRDATQDIAPIAADLVAHVRGGAASDEPLWDKHYHPDFESVEADGTAAKGRDKVQEKHDWWCGRFTVHGTTCEGPFLQPDGFSVIFDMDVEAKDGSMPRTQMREIATYTVRGGKIVREQFLSPPE